MRWFYRLDMCVCVCVLVCSGTQTYRIGGCYISNECTCYSRYDIDVNFFLDSNISLEPREGNKKKSLLLSKVSRLFKTSKVSYICVAVQNFQVISIKYLYRQVNLFNIVHFRRYINVINTAVCFIREKLLLRRQNRHTFVKKIFFS